MTDLTIPEDGMRITRDTAFAPGVYALPNGIEIAADGVTLDGNGALLIGGGFAGRGVSARHCSGVTIRNLNIERYYHGIWLSACSAAHVSGCAITRTHEVNEPDVFLDTWLDRGAAYGAAIMLSGVVDSVIQSNDLRHQQNGALLYGCNRVEVARNDASHNSGAGMLLYESSDNMIVDNVADFCCRISQSRAGRPGIQGPDAARYHNGADAAGLVIMGSSSRNKVLRNFLRSGGDGVFLGGLHKDMIPVPCNDNLFEYNDCSDSPNIAFEATFSSGNIFRHNRADNCNYGFWLGWSGNTQVEGNQIRNNRIGGVSIEHGHHNVITGNKFEKNRDGVQLWANLDDQRNTAEFGAFFPEGRESHTTEIRGNDFARHDHAIHCWSARGEAPIARCHHFAITDNTLTDNRIAIKLDRVRDSRVQGNQILSNVEAGIRMTGCQDMAIADNVMDR